MPTFNGTITTPGGTTVPVSMNTGGNPIITLAPPAFIVRGYTVTTAAASVTDADVERLYYGGRKVAGWIYDHAVIPGYHAVKDGIESLRDRIRHRGG